MVSFKGAAVVVLSLAVTILVLLPLVLEGSWLKWEGGCSTEAELREFMGLSGQILDSQTRQEMEESLKQFEPILFKGGTPKKTSSGVCVIECGYKECKSGDATTTVAYFDYKFKDDDGVEKSACSLQVTETLGTVATYVSIAVVVLMGLLTLFHGAALFMADDSMATPKKVARGLHILVAILIIVACSVTVIPLTMECRKPDEKGNSTKETPSMAIAPVVLGVAVVLQFVNYYLAPTATTPPPAYGAYGTNPGGANYHNMEGAYGKAPADTSPYASSPAGRGGGPLAPPANNYDYSSGQF